jgi:aminoglycoside 3-N-acetyltransferase I
MGHKQSQVLIRILDESQTDDFISLIKIFEQVFEMENFRIPDNIHLASTLNRSEFKVFVAEIDKTVVGGATIYMLEQYYSTRPLAYIYDLGVLNEFQRLGIGRNIIEFIKNYCRSNGFEEVFVQADEEDDYALDFYRSTKPTKEEKVRHFYYSFH